MTSSFKKWVQRAYPPRDVPLLRGHRPRSILLDNAETVEIRYPPPHPLRRGAEHLGPANERMKQRIGEQH